MRMMLYIALSLSLVFLSCNRYDSPAGPANGALTGFVNTLDENGTPIENRKDVKVVLENTNFSTLTDSSGHWKLENVPAGVYTLAFSRDSLSTNKMISYQFVGNGTAYIGITPIPSIPRSQTYLDSIVVDSVDDDDSDTGIIVYGSLTEQVPFALTRTIMLFIGENDNISSDPATYTGVIPTFVSGGNVSFTEFIPFSQLEALGFHHKSQIKITSYILSRTYYRYPDVTTGKVYYSGISTRRKNFMSVVVP